MPHRATMASTLLLAHLGPPQAPMGTGRVLELIEELVQGAAPACSPAAPPVTLTWLMRRTPRLSSTRGPTRQ